ncbi:hypothetical protein [Clostridium oryzae]|uniref:Lipoprotein n=1 Tax=Clostridium oryzae TaxID=1450648 RepID=A0A1V4IK45_9CLOT|nr:hypothetical protein [Clostridium oryzae]OPJ60194.1 hypothetical protein CLORY_29150 [Clostridium oryzae]
MKRRLTLVAQLLIIILLMGCNVGKNQNSIKSNNNPAATSTKTNKEEADVINIPDNIKDMGKGSISISTPSGSSENGKVPFIYNNKDATMEQIGLNTNNIDGSKLSYVLVDGIISDKDQLSDSQSTLTLQGDHLKAGKHKVELLQFSNDKPTGKIITYKTANYEVKSK